MIGVLPVYDAVQRAYKRRIILSYALYRCYRSGKVSTHGGVMKSMTKSVRKMAGVMGI